MARFRHIRTGREVEAGEAVAQRYRANSRWVEIMTEVVVPSGTVADLLAWAGDDSSRRAALLASERAGKKRKGILDALA